MEKLKQNNWWCNVKGFKKCLSTVFLLLIFTACKNIIREVEVKVYNVDTNEGIPNIELFTESGGEYVTDNRGIAVISGEGNLYGRKINTRLTVEGYVYADYYETCEVGKSYSIDEENLRIPLLQHAYVKVRAFKKEDSNYSQVCVVLPGNACPSDLGLTSYAEVYKLNSDGTQLESPMFTQGNTKTMFRPTNEEEQRVELFYNSDCSDIKGSPDTSYDITLSRGDTIHIDLYF